MNNVVFSTKNIDDFKSEIVNDVTNAVVARLTGTSISPTTKPENCGLRINDVADITGCTVNILYNDKL